MDNINSALIIFSFIVQSNIEKKEEILLFLKNFILENVLSKKEQTISYLYLQVLIFCNYYNIDIEEYDFIDIKSHTCSECYILLIKRDNNKYIQMYS